ncbi:hypothetical protein DSECCO2_452410 [anaerobic digester metagenome]|uniref:hypothetical protein n=1 Tax=Acetobacterium wieringae TaxID=52694 RepID=UPI0020344C02|nr:hypothetical protein [Acetobacterium wieringae]URN84528.1 hypothetical protein CHL1_000092 [Acetobacterium wieringae]
MDEKIKKRINKKFDYSKVCQDLKYYDNLNTVELEKEKMYLKIEIETEKKYNREFFFAIVAIMVAAISIIITSVGNLMTVSEKLVSLTEIMSEGNEEMLTLYHEALKAYAESISQNVESNKLYLIIIICILLFSLYLCFTHIGKCRQYGIRVAIYEKELEYVGKLIEEKMKIANQKVKAGTEKDEKNVNGWGMILISLISYFLIKKNDR